MLEYRSWNFYVLKLFFRINIFQKYLVSECLKLSGCKMWYGGDSFIAFGIRNSTPNDIIVTVWAISVRAQFNSAVYYAWIYYIYCPQKPQTRENRFTLQLIFFFFKLCWGKTKLWGGGRRGEGEPHKRDRYFSNFFIGKALSRRTKHNNCRAISKMRFCCAFRLYFLCKHTPPFLFSHKFVLNAA